MKGKYLSVFIAVLLLVIAFSGCLEETTETVLSFSYEECDTMIENDSETGLSLKWEDEVNKTVWVDNSSLNILAYVTINCAESIIAGSYDIMNDTLLLYYTIRNPLINARCMCTQTLYYNFTNLEKKEYHFKLVEIIDDV